MSHLADFVEHHNRTVNITHWSNWDYGNPIWHRVFPRWLTADHTASVTQPANYIVQTRDVISFGFFWLCNICTEILVFCEGQSKYGETHDNIYNLFHSPTEYSGMKARNCKMLRIRNRHGVLINSHARWKLYAVVMKPDSRMIQKTPFEL